MAPRRAALGAMRLASPTLPPDSPEMSESEPFLAGYDRSASSSPVLGRRPPPLGLALNTSSPSPLGLKHFSSAPTSPALPAYSPRIDAGPPSPYFSESPSTPTTGVAAVAGNRRFRLLAFSALALVAIIGFASLGAADPERLHQVVVAPVKDAWQAAGSAAHKGYDEVKSWIGYDQQWQNGDFDDELPAPAQQTTNPIQVDRPEELVEPEKQVEPDRVDEQPVEETIDEPEPPREDMAIIDEPSAIASVSLAPTPTQSAAPSAQASQAPTTPVAEEAEPESHAIYVLPDPPRVPTDGPEEKFFAYLPHSGFHNQRIELANAMTLAWYFKRTLLVPPVWIGWPHTTLPRQKLQNVWTNQMKLHPQSFEMHNAQPQSDERDDSANVTSESRLQPRQKASSPKGKGSSPKPPQKQLTEEECKSYAKECRKTYQDTFIAWSFLTDLDLASARVPLVDRFNMSEAFMYETTGATPETTYVLEDDGKYWYQFYDEDPNDEEMIVKWDMATKKYENRVSLTKLAEHTKDYKLLTMGSTFGSTRLQLKKATNFRTLGHFHRSLAFRNPLLDTPSNRIRDLLGGPGRYVGVHARVGDGQFMLYAINHMHRTFDELVFEKLKVDKSHSDALRAAGDELAATFPQPSATPARRALLEERSPWASLDEMEERDMLFSQSGHPLLEKRQDRADRFVVPDREQSPLSSSLKCRRELHTDPALFALNSPLYIATDSAHPLQDPALAIFFANFPCSFILSDFDRPSEYNTGPPVTSLRTMELATNVNDGVKLGRLLLPFMEAAVAAKAGEVSGTNGSTFSAFSCGPLHKAYQDDEKQNAFDD